MNDAHLELLASDDWRTMLRDLILPFAFDTMPAGDLGTRVLEVGPGPGLTTDLLSQELDHVTAVELDPGLANALSGRYDGSDRVTVVEADATSMPFPDDHFTGAVSFTMLHHVPEPAMQDRLFAEVGRVLRPGGWFVCSDSVESDDLAALHVDDVYNPIDPATLEARLRAAGFDTADLRTNEFAFAFRAQRST
ncbi:MAG: class I SAM-dependent methyltransferase [Acidimicrobiia bacterium]|jgi:SAM-dependent methyltransferase